MQEGLIDVCKALLMANQMKDQEEDGPPASTLPWLAWVTVHISFH
jgi:hypothetical protein